MKIGLIIETDDFEADQSIIQDMLSSKLKGVDITFLIECDSDAEFDSLIEVHFFDLSMNGDVACSASINISSEDECVNFEFSLNDAIEFSERNSYVLLERVLKLIDLRSVLKSFHNKA